MLALCLKEATVRFKSFAIIVAVFVLCGVASAQAYDIRTTSRNNLRAEPSLDGTFIETVPAGTVLHVVGRSGRWLKINRNGNEVWMADWVGYSRVESSAGPAPQPASNVPAQVDNCCFVDRHCATDAEWSEGWHAFQNNQCAAPGQPQTSQPASNVPAQVDNCCFVDRQCNTPADWENGFYAFRDNQCPAPAQSQSQTSAQPADIIPAQVDNCCFVDRQCNTPADWENGFYAFRDNQCPASTVSQPVTVKSSAAPISAAILLSTPYMTEGVRLLLANPSVDPFNNCCHMRYQHKDCHSSAEWEAGYYAFQNNQCIRPAPLGTRPTIEGSARFVSYAERALELIEIHAPEWLKYIYVSGVRKIKMIDTVPVNSSVSGMGFNNIGWITHDVFRQRLDPNWAPSNHELVSLAGALAHEACHAMQQRTYSQSAGWTNEAACLEAQLAVIEAINRRHSSIHWLRDLIANIQNPDRWWW